MEEVRQESQNIVFFFVFLFFLLVFPRFLTFLWRAFPKESQNIFFCFSKAFSLFSEGPSPKSLKICFFVFVFPMLFHFFLYRFLILFVIYQLHYIFVSVIYSFITSYATGLQSWLLFLAFFCIFAWNIGLGGF